MKINSLTKCRFCLTIEHWEIARKQLLIIPRVHDKIIVDNPENQINAK